MQTLEGLVEGCPPCDFVAVPPYPKDHLSVPPPQQRNAHRPSRAACNRIDANRGVREEPNFKDACAHDQPEAKRQVLRQQGARFRRAGERTNLAHKQATNPEIAATLIPDLTWITISTKARNSKGNTTASHQFSRANLAPRRERAVTREKVFWQHCEPQPASLFRAVLPPFRVWVLGLGSGNLWEVEMSPRQHV